MYLSEPRCVITLQDYVLELKLTDKSNMLVSGSGGGGKSDSGSSLSEEPMENRTFKSLCICHAEQIGSYGIVPPGTFLGGGNNSPISQKTSLSCRP